MSWDIFVSCFRNGEVGSFPRETFDRAFKEITYRDQYGGLSLMDCHGVIYVDDEPEIGSFLINRPPGRTDHPF